MTSPQLAASEPLTPFPSPDGRGVLPLRITDAARPYLELQQGAIADLAKSRRDWEAAYAWGLKRTLAGLAPWLPSACRRVLDVGGGMGGIDAVLNAHFGGEVEVRILDGRQDRPAMRHHDESFSHHGAAAGFLAANGVRAFVGIDAADVGSAVPVDCELVISLQAWCFHFGPDRYLEFVRACCLPETRLILDVRATRPEWAEALFGPKAPFRFVGLAIAGQKFNRVVLEPA